MLLAKHASQAVQIDKVGMEKKKRKEGGIEKKRKPSSSEMSYW